MRTETDHSYRWRGMRFRLALFALSLVLFAFMAAAIWAGGDPLNLWTALFALSVIAGLYFEYRLKRSYHCPNCRARLGAPALMPAPGKDTGDFEYVYDCAPCEISWRTRTYPPDSAG